MTFIGELRPYQAEASAFVQQRERALLALDLGTGKTVVSIHAIEQLREEGKIKCALLIMSSSLTVQWKDRIEQFTNADSVILVDGSIPPKKRLSILENAITQPPQYLIMGIRQVVDNLRLIMSMAPDLVLVDEVTSIKNFGSQQSKAIKKLTSPYRIGLTAEPIENGKAEELFSIMQWVDPKLFGSWQSFEENYIVRNAYNIITSYKNVDQMHSLLTTACFNKRRTDKEVAEFMPTVKEFNIYIEMDEETRVLYKAIVRELLRVLYESKPSATQDLSGYYSGTQSGNNDTRLGPIGSRLLAASLLLDSPILLRASGDAYNASGGESGSQYAASLLERLTDPSEGFYGAKVEACVELVQEYLEADPRHKVIVFARFKGVLPMLAEQLDNYGSVLFTGDLNGKQRGEAIRFFTTQGDTRLFLSSDAGGYGVDLYVASHLINFDLPNSSGTFKQRNGRHVRASSVFREVVVDNLIVAGSVEEYQKQRLDYKSRVANAVVSGQMSERDGRVTNDVQSLTKFLENYLEA